jgi:hypothetical protein
MASAIDLFFVYQFIKGITTPFDETDAYELGLIDENGKKLKSAQTSKEKDALSTFNKLIFNLKRILSKIPGGNTKFGSYAAALFLLKEGSLPDDEKIVRQGILKEMEFLEERTEKSFDDIFTEDIANSTGAAVAGTGADAATWVPKKRGRPKVLNRFISASVYLKRTARSKRKKEQMETANNEPKS